MHSGLVEPAHQRDFLPGERGSWEEQGPGGSVVLTPTLAGSSLNLHLSATVDLISAGLGGWVRGEKKFPKFPMGI